MASIKTIIDTRSVNKNGLSPIKIKISQKGVSVHISLGIKANASDFDVSNERLFRGKHYKQYNAIIETKRADIRRAMFEVSATNDLNTMSASQIKSAVLSIIEPPTEDNMVETSVTLASYFKDFANSRTAKGTQQLYLRTLGFLSKFFAVDALTFEDITVKFLQEFERKLAQTQGINARSIHLRNLRAVVNSAIDDEITTTYAFRKFKIRKEQTRKRALSVATLREIISAELPELWAYHRDMFVLSFLLIGINATDLYDLQEEDERGYVHYKRHKTAKLYSVKLCAEAMEIINRHRGSDGYLLDIRQKYSALQRFQEANNTQLKKFRDGLSYYWARHTWATIAADLDIPIDTISHALGHSIGNSTTAIYIDFNERKVEQANAKVVAYVYGNCTKVAPNVTENDNLEQPP